MTALLCMYTLKYIFVMFDMLDYIMLVRLDYALEFRNFIYVTGNSV